MSTLTPRQEEVLARLESSMSAQQIADELGISRNAVYQQIQAIRKKGHLDAGYTPSGQPPRSPDAPVRATQGEPIAMQLIATMSHVADELERMAEQLRVHIGSS